MKAADMLSKSEQELHKQLQQWREQLATLHRERFVNEATNVHQARTVRKDIARNLTVLRQRREAQPAIKTLITKRSPEKEK